MKNLQNVVPLNDLEVDPVEIFTFVAEKLWEYDPTIEISIASVNRLWITAVEDIKKAGFLQPTISQVRNIVLADLLGRH